MLKLVFPKRIYENKQTLRKTNENIDNWRLNNIFQIYKRVYLNIAMKEICSSKGTKLFAKKRQIVMPEVYSEFKCSLKSVFQNAYKNKHNLADKVIQFRLDELFKRKSKRVFKLSNMLIGYLQENKKKVKLKKKGLKPE